LSATLIESLFGLSRLPLSKHCRPCYPVSAFVRPPFYLVSAVAPPLFCIALLSLSSFLRFSIFPIPKNNYIFLKNIEPFCSFNRPLYCKTKGELMKSLEVLCASLREQLSETLCTLPDLSDDALFAVIDDTLAGLSAERLLSVAERLSLRSSLFNSFRRLDILQELLDRNDVTEIMVNGKDRIFIERRGKIERCDLRFSSEEQLEDLIQRIVSRVNRSVNVSTPIADARLPDGSRVHVVLPPISLGGPAVTIRKFPEPITMERLIGYGTLTAEAAAFLKKTVAAGYNIFISGGTNSGKTTFLNALSAFIPASERVITIEDSAELQLLHIENLVRLETRNRTAEGEGQVRISDLIRASLRMNPDRIIVGEVRGAEALDMLQAMNTGHDGSLSTGHANSATDMLTRLETMALGGANLPLEAVQRQISGALDLIVHLGRLRDRSRRVLSVSEVGGVSHGEIQVHELFAFREEGGQSNDKCNGRLIRVGSLKNRAKLEAAGLKL